MKFLLLCLVLCFSCGKAVKEVQSVAPAPAEKSYEEKARERIREDFEQFLRRARLGSS